VNPVETDPRVSCPIVCDEELGATGFFYRTGEQTYLVTARHNILPTNMSDLRSGNTPHALENSFRPKVDIYLRKSGKSELRTVDIRSTDGVKSSSSIDIVAIPIDFDPQAFDYVVWSAGDVITPGSGASTLEVFGFPRRCFQTQASQYDTDLFRDMELRPSSFTLANPDTSFGNSTDLADIGYDENIDTDLSEYAGYSGAPILGEGLVGVFSNGLSHSNEVTAAAGFQPMIYWPAVHISALLTH